MPRFTQRTPLDVKEALIALGLSDLFNEKKADLTRIANLRNKEENLYVSDIVHEAVVKMHEAGTVAAAATAVVISKETMAAPPVEEEIVNFHAIRPFFFYIVHMPSKVILFVGRVDEPH